MKTTKFFISVFLCLTLIISFTSCSDDDNPEAVNKEDLITDVILTFSARVNPSVKVVLTSSAPEGQDGPSTETITGKFIAGVDYLLTISVLNKTKKTVEDVLIDDIIPEAENHFFVYEVSGIKINMARESNDVIGFGGEKLGVKTAWIAGAASTGNIKIKLVHLPTSADDATGFGSVTGGSPYFDITFNGAEIENP